LRQLIFVLVLSSVTNEFLGLIADELADRCLFSSRVQYCLPFYDELGLFIICRLADGPWRWS